MPRSCLEVPKRDGHASQVAPYCKDRVYNRQMIQLTFRNLNGCKSSPLVLLA